MFKVGGKAVVRVTDNVLFEGGRERLLEKKTGVTPCCAYFWWY
jgi:hypothetical protein